MPSLRHTVGSALGTITTTADAITSTINTAVIGVDMLSAWAQNEQAKQKANLKYDSLIVEKEAKQRATLRIADLNIEAATYSTKSPVHAAAITQATDELEAMLKAST